MARIHHATLAKAKKFKITLSLEDNDVVACDKDGNRLASGLAGNKVLEEAITKLTGHPAKKAVVKKAPRIVTVEGLKAAMRRSNKKRDEEEELEDEEGADEVEQAEADYDAEIAEEEDSDADLRRPGVKHKYKELYKPFGGKCGDDLSTQISEHVSYVDEDGKTKIDKAALKRFAKANDAWKPLYETLTTKSGAWNAGMARMNVSNILRAKLRRAEKEETKFEIDWA